MNKKEKATLDGLLANDVVIDTAVMALECDNRDTAKRAIEFLMMAIDEGEDSVYKELPCGVTARDLLYTHLILMAMTDPAMAIAMGWLDRGQMVQNLMAHMYQFGYTVGRREGEVAAMVNKALGDES